jgi:mRNA-degrading endonuclease RelE of RelBE toxin-antitoxin system
VKYRARFTPEAASIIQKLHPDIKRRVRAAVDGLLDSPLAGHALHDELSGLRSFRMGKHRIVYRINDPDRALEFLLVGLRRDIYQELRERLLQGLNIPRR